MTYTDSWLYKEVLPLPWIQFKIPHCDYADDIALTSNTAENLQLQLNKFYDYTRLKGSSWTLTKQK